MSNFSSSEISNNRAKYPEVTQADLQQLLIKLTTTRVAGRSPAKGFILLFVVGLKANCCRSSEIRIGLKPIPRKQSITISLDANLIEYFKLKAGESGYQNLINEVLRQAKEQEELQKVSP